MVFLRGYTAQTASLVKMLQHPDATPSNEDMFKFLDGSVMHLVEWWNNWIWSYNMFSSVPMIMRVVSQWSISWPPHPLLKGWRWQTYFWRCKNPCSNGYGPRAGAAGRTRPCRIEKRGGFDEQNRMPSLCIRHWYTIPPPGIAVLLATEIWIDCGKHTYGDAFNTLRFNVNRHAYDQDGFNQVAECFWNGLRDRLRWPQNKSNILVYWRLIMYCALWIL